MKKTLLICLSALICDCRHIQAQSEPVASTEFPTVALILFVCSIVLCLILSYLPERRSSQSLRRYTLSQSICQQANPFSSLPPNSLLWLTGNTTSTQPIKDDVSGMRVNDAVKIIRTVEVKEGKQGCKEGTKWVQEHQMVDLKNWWVRSAEVMGGRVRLAAYQLTDQIKAKCVKRETIIPVKQDADSIIQNLKVLNRVWTIVDEYIYFAKTRDIDEEGTLRIKYEKCPVGPLSLLCQKSASSNMLEAFDIHQEIVKQQSYRHSKAKAICFDNEQSNLIIAVEQSMKTKQQMLRKLFNKGCCFDCGLRIIIYVLFVLFSFYFIHKLTAYYGHIPILGGILTNPSIFWQLFATIILTFPIYLLIISIPWFMNFRAIGVGLLISSVIFASVILLIYLIKKIPSPSSTINHHRHF